MGAAAACCLALAVLLGVQGDGGGDSGGLTTGPSSSSSASSASESASESTSAALASGLVVAFGLCGKLAVTVAFAATWVVVGEAFPTPLRSRAVAACAFAAHAG